MSYGETAPEFHESFQDLVLSSRKVLFNRFLTRSKEYTDFPDELSSMDEALSVLVQMEQSDKETVNELLLAPATGSWLAHTVGRLEHTVESDVPLWQDIGFFNNIVAGFAHNCGVGFTLTAPIINGDLHIPQQGTAVLGESTAGVAKISSDGDKLTVQSGMRILDEIDPTIEMSSWRPVHRVSTKTHTPEHYADIYGDMKLSILLDDADPYNGGTTVDKLCAEEVERWASILDDAWEILVRASPNIASQLSAGLSVIVPHPQNKPFEAYSSSGSTSIGSIRASFPTSALEAAEILVHEYCGHSSLNKFLLASPLIPRDSSGSTLYAPWRDDPRPSGGILHGIYSFSRVVDFYDAVHKILEPDDSRLPLVDFERNLWQSEVRDSATDLLNIWYGQKREPVEDRFAPSPFMFKGVVSALYGQAYPIQPPADDPVRSLLLNASNYIAKNNAPTISQDFSAFAGILSLVGLAKADHRALWKAHHVEPDPAVIDAFSDAWLNGEVVGSADMATRIKANPAACKLHARALLMRYFLSDEVKFREDFEQSTELMDRADRALILGKSAIAKALYTDALERNPLDPKAFVGVGLSDRQDKNSPNKFFTYWLRRPYVMLALQAAITDKSGRAADYHGLNSWLLEGKRI
jgi:HEXXH motif-containing protein